MQLTFYTKRYYFLIIVVTEKQKSMYILSFIKCFNNCVKVSEQCQILAYKIQFLFLIHIEHIFKQTNTSLVIIQKKF